MTSYAQQKFPIRHLFLVQSSSRFMLKNKGPEVAIAFLTNEMENAHDEKTRATLLEKLERAYVSKHLKLLKQALKKYKERFGQSPDNLKALVDKNILTTLPLDPRGGQYYLGRESAEIVNESEIKPLVFRAKTARSGIIEEEFSETPNTAN